MTWHTGPTGKIFADLHHFDLYFSFQRLFETRLGYELSRPIGSEWKTEEYWALSSCLPVEAAYLSRYTGVAHKTLKPYWQERPALWARFAMEMMRIGKIKEYESGRFAVEDLSKPGVWQRAITLERFKQEKFDIIISSVPQHWELFEKLRKEYQPQAKHIFHMGPGNVEWEVPTGCKNVMHHDLTPKPGVHQVSYNQEFELDTFCYKPHTNPVDVVHSYVHWPESEKLWWDMKTGWGFYFWGKTLGSLDDTIVETSMLANAIRASRYTWHIKPGGESYGHILHNTYACGRPAIINMEDYVLRRGGLLLTDMETCIDMTGLSPSALKDKILAATKDHEAMCQAAYERFHETVDFAVDAARVKTFLENLR